MTDATEGLIHNSPPDSPGRMSNSSSRLSPKQYILVNMSKFIVEMVGTCVVGVFYSLIGDRQEGILLGIWVITLFGQAISGAHFNPTVTLSAMLRKNSNFGSRRLLGIMYIAAQCAGGVLSAMLVLFLNGNREIGMPLIAVDIEDVDVSTKGFSSIISEVTGTFFFVFMFMLCTDEKTRFSSDKVVNCFIIASAYISGRLIAGGSMVSWTVGNSFLESLTTFENNKNLINLGALAAASAHNKFSGPLLNPAIYFGQMIVMIEFTWIINYAICPVGGAVLAVLFYELIFVKTQDYLNDNGSVDSREEDDVGPGPMKQSTIMSEKVAEAEDNSD